MTGYVRMSLVPILVYGLAEGLVRGLNLAFLPLMTRLFSTSQFGEIALFTTVMSLIGLLANCGLGNAVHRFYFDPLATTTTRRSSISAGFWALFVMSATLVSLSCAILGGAALISTYALPQIATPLVVCLLTVIPMQLVQFGQDVLRLYSAHWQYFFVSVLKTIAAFAVGLGVVYWLDAGVTGYFFGILSGQLLLLTWIVVSLAKALRCRPDIKEAVRMVQYGSPFVVAGLAQWLMTSADLWAVGALVGAADVGVYSLCLKLAAVVSLVTTAFGLAWSPQILRLHAEDPGYRSVAGETLFRLAAFLIFFATAVIATIPYIFSWLIPSEYGRPFFIIVLLAYSAAIMGTCQVTILGMVFEKRSDLIAKVNWVVAIIAAGLSWGLVSLYGVFGAAAANLVTSIMLTCGYFSITKRIHPLDYSLRDIRFLVMFAGSCVLAAAVMAVIDESVYGLIVRMLMLGMLFIWLWKSMNWSQLVKRRQLGAQ